MSTGDGLAVFFSVLFLEVTYFWEIWEISADIFKVSERLLSWPIDYLEGKERQQNTGLQAPKLIGVIWGTLTFSLRLS